MADGRTADPETYLHRIGRTGRFGRVGVALTFVHNKASWQQLHDIANYFKTDLHPIDTRYVLVVKNQSRRPSAGNVC